MNTITPDMQRKLDERSQKGNLRSLSVLSLPYDFTSNDYLGLARSPELSAHIEARLRQWGAPAHGSTGSRLLSGNSSPVMELEAKLAHLFHSQAALLFNSGYTANLCLVSSVAQKGDTILYDQLSHVCLKEGAWLSKAHTFAFRHNDPADLEARLSRAEGNVFVVAESVYSMDGDIAPLSELAELCSRYGARLIVDEAHSVGVFGEAGNGLVCSLGLEESFFARVYTFGKAMGTHGAVVAGSADLINYLVNFGRPFIYTTAMPLHSVVAIEQAFDFLRQHPSLAQSLQQKIQLFTSLFPETPYLRRLPSHTAIQPVLVPGNDTARHLAATLQAQGFDVRPILAPTVKEGEERLRICLHAYNSDEEIEWLCNTLALQR